MTRPSRTNDPQRPATPRTGAPTTRATFSALAARTVGAAIPAVALALACAAPLRAEQPLELDIHALATSPHVLPAAVQGPVWHLEPREGRRLIAIPFRTTTPGAELHLDEPSITLNFARFVAWHLPDDEPEPATATRRTRGARDPGFDDYDMMQEQRMREQYQRMLQQQQQQQHQRQRTQQQQQRLQQLQEEEPQLSPEGVPLDAPRLAREITLTPDGEVHWALDTSISGAEIREDDGRYILRLRPDRLRQLAPSRDALEVDDDLPAQQRARALQQARDQFQQARDDYAALRDEVQNLDESFSRPAPDRIWAIYELPPTMRDLAFDGPDPLPWAKDFHDFEALRAFAGTGGPRRTGSGRGGRISTDVEPLAITDLRRLARSSHRYDQQMAAHAVAAAGLADGLERFTDAYRLFEDLLRADDDPARNAAVSALTDVGRPSDATAALLRSVADHRDPRTRLAALGGLLRDDDPAEHLPIAQALLADPAGPAPADILDSLLAAADASRNLTDQAVDALDFDPLAPDRLAAAIDHLVTAAPGHELAARWLDRRLLGSASPDVVHATLDRLARPDDAADGDRSMLGQALGLLWGRSDDQPQPVAEPDPFLAGPDDFFVEDDEQPTLVLIDSIEHNLFDALEDPDTAGLAFEALPRFTFSQAGSRRGQGGGFGRDRNAERYERIVEAALAHDIPAQAVEFLARHQTQQAGEALARLAAEGSTLAATHLLGRPWELGNIIEQLDADQRHALGSAAYEAVHGRAALVAGLLRAEPEQRRRHEGARWFAEHLPLGQLPGAHEWVEPFGGRSRLLELVESSDADLAAGAIAALLAAAGAHAQEVDARAEQVLQADSPASAFRSAERALNTARLQELAGQHRLEVLIRGEVSAVLADMPPEQARRYREQERAMQMQGMGGDPARRQPQHDDRSVSQRVSLGVVELIPDDQGNVQLGGDILSLSIPAELFALRIERVADLRNLPVPALDNLPLDQIDRPLDLLPQPDGSLRGQAPLHDGRTFELVMEPAD